MKVTFLIPPPLDGKDVPERVAGCAYGLYAIPNIFELAVAAVAEDAGCKVNYVDFPLYGKKEGEFIDFLQKDDSEVYCFYAVNLSIETDKIAHEKIRQIRGKDIAVVFYGPAPSDKPQNFALDENTFVVRGEPEMTFQNLLDTLAKNGDVKKVKGLTYFNGKEITHNSPAELIKDLDLLPLPARHLVDKDKYFNPKLGVKPFTAAITSRNCPYQCLYCVPCSLSFAREIEHKRYFDNKKPPISFRSPKSVIREMEHLAAEGYKGITFLDDLFTWNDERTIEICEGMAGLGLKWGCATRADRITEKSVKAMAKAGCVYIDMGIESFVQDILNYVKKDLKVDSIENAIKIIKSNGIKAKVNVLIGCSPLETKETIRYNQKMVKKLDVDQVMYNICNPFPGTEFYKIAEEKGWFVHGAYKPADVQKEAIISYPHLTNRDLEKAVKRGNLQFFLTPKFIMRNINKFDSLESFVSALKALYRKLV